MKTGNIFLNLHNFLSKHPKHFILGVSSQQIQFALHKEILNDIAYMHFMLQNIELS